jgi:cyclic beta-1,2-glucan synthetase
MPAAATAAGRTWPSRAGARTAPRQLGQLLLRARPGHGRFWSTTYQPTLAEPRKYEPSSPKAAPNSVAATRHRPVHRNRGLAGGRHRAAPHPHHQLVRTAAHHRGDQLCRSGDGAAAADAAHPAFSKLFVQTEILRDENAHPVHAPAAWRRRCHAWLFHLMTVHDAPVPDASFETDRARFLGRGNSLPRPAALGEEPQPLPAAGLGARSGGGDPLRVVTLEPDQTAIVDLVWGAETARGLRCTWSTNTRTATWPTACSNWHGPTARSCCASSTPARPTRSCTPPGQQRDLSERRAARRGRHPAAQPARPVGPVGYAISGDLPIVLLQIKRPGQHRAGAPAGAGPRLLAPQGPGGGPGDLVRGPSRATASACRTRSWA